MLFNIFYNTFSDREEFEMPFGTHRWEVFLVISHGSFALSFEGREEMVINENEIAYFPIGVRFERRVIEPISFHQFAFVCDTSHPFFKSLSEGKLDIPHEQVRAMINGMEHISETRDGKELILHMTERICAEQFIYGGKEGRRAHGYSEDILTVIKLMNDRLGEKIDIGSLALEVYLSHTGLIKKFTKQVGVPPSQYLIMLRMRYAKQLLLLGDMPINEIAARCGYSNAYYFTNAFHKSFGVSPSGFRKRALKTN